ncbi:SRPBCC domain-containing protein [Belliella kenyensis]|uniref:SRPBCC domain-containing protein n=1 Tax=Belliella kenyensis TaxID=1472724 RepID=A0ABV8EGQ0_9BACT|nr:SRPBCC domain-containing protein [Belliella kenyensis]MCH7401859.1 SRPBCC domain-containing protein [Belliella kenyensis]MDN3604359.1 SRPBCC domain-containing protein [Belliella kenyensis]
MKKSEQAIVVEQVFDVSVLELWKAITELDQMKKWFFVNIETFEEVLGFETRFVVENKGRIFPHLWKITEVDPFRKITYNWKYEGYKGDSDVTFELFGSGEQSKLTLTHTVLEDFSDEIPEFSRESCEAGWTYFIKQSLKEYLQSK